MKLSFRLNGEDKSISLEEVKTIKNVKESDRTAWEVALHMLSLWKSIPESNQWYRIQHIKNVNRLYQAEIENCEYPDLQDSFINEIRIFNHLVNQQKE